MRRSSDNKAGSYSALTRVTAGILVLAALTQMLSPAKLRFDKKQ